MKKENVYVEWLFGLIKSKKLDLYNVICNRLINGRKEEITIGHLLNLYANAPIELQAKLKSEFIVNLYFNNRRDIITDLTIMFERLICENVKINNIL